MTNGEKFKQTFHATEGEHTQDDLIIPVSVGEIRMCFLAKWWNAEYKEPNDTKTITISKGAVKHGNKDYVVYKRDWLMEHLDSEFEVLKGARKLGEKIKNAKPSTWLTDGLTQEEVEQAIKDGEERAETERKCAKCKHHVPKCRGIWGELIYGCESWECKFEPKGVEE